MKHEFKAIPKEEPKQQLGGIPKGRIDMVVGKSKQETLEEAALRLYSYVNDDTRLLFINGAKWQQEQDKNKYSEEEVLDIIKYYDIEFKLDTFSYTKPCSFRIEEWFEQFKKK